MAQARARQHRHGSRTNQPVHRAHAVPDIVHTSEHPPSITMVTRGRGVISGNTSSNVARPNNIHKPVHGARGGGAPHAHQPGASTSRGSTDTVPPSSSRAARADVQHTGITLTNSDVNVSDSASVPGSARLDTQTGGGDSLPDILNSHVLPPYASRPNQHRAARQHSDNTRDDHNTRITNNNTRDRTTRERDRTINRITLNMSPGVGGEGREVEGKKCCSRAGCISCVTTVTTFRWVLVSLAMLGVCCVVTGIILGALHMTVGPSFLTLSLMFIGLGVMLVVVVGVGWRCTPAGHEPCHLLFNLGEHANADRGGGRGRRDRHWHGGMSYPEFPYRRPPPSYNTSMQQYQQQIMMAQLQGVEGNNPPQGEGEGFSPPASPPPTYRSQASTIRPGIQITFPPQVGEGGSSSRPPTYRSHVSDAGNRPAIDITSQGVDNLACTEAVQINISSVPQPSSSSDVIVLNNAGNRPAIDISAGVPDSASSTLHKAHQVVKYLDGMLEEQIRTMNNAGGAPATGSGTASTVSTPATQTPSNTREQTPESGDGNESVVNETVADTPL